MQTIAVQISQTETSSQGMTLGFVLKPSTQVEMSRFPENPVVNFPGGLQKEECGRLLWI